MKQKTNRIFSILQRVFSLLKKSCKGHELKIISNHFLKTFLRLFSKITLCYVQIGWLVTGGDLLYFSQHKSHEGLADGVGKGLGTGKEISEDYEPKANSVLNRIYNSDIPIYGTAICAILLLFLELLKLASRQK